jgi:hypothetical protein
VEALHSLNQSLEGIWVRWDNLRKRHFVLGTQVWIKHPVTVRRERKLPVRSELTVLKDPMPILLLPDSIYEAIGLSATLAILSKSYMNQRFELLVFQRADNAYPKGFFQRVLKIFGATIIQ